MYVLKPLTANLSYVRCSRIHINTSPQQGEALYLEQPRSFAAQLYRSEMQQRLVLFVSLFAAAALLPPSFATSCPSECGRCPPLRLSECRAGKVKDICGCCFVCAKAFGERCGGIDRIHGTCGVNLTCISPRFDKGLCMPVTPSSTPPTTTASSSRTVSLPTNTSSGVPPTATTTPASRNCLQVPMCNLSYCNDNRNKICRVNR